MSQLGVSGTTQATKQRSFDSSGGMDVPHSIEITIAKSHVMDNYRANWP